MREFFLKTLEQLRKLWQALEPSQKITITLLSALVIISLFFIGMWGSRPDFETLYSGLEGQDASEVIAKLSEAGVPYKIGAGGSSIMVPKKNVYEMRIQMAASGLPKGSGQGYEIFDNFKLGATDFTQKVNYQRALQTELERTISQLGQIRQARVHVAIPDEQLFADEKQYTTASVVLDLIGVSPLSNKQIQGIVHLVASSVKGLSPENITIIDTSGNLLYNSSDSMGGSSASGGFSSVQIEAQGMFERAVERRIQSMLISVLGPNKSVVRVSAELDFDRETVESEIYEPTEEPIPRSERLTEESYTGSGKSSQGIPGTASNIPGTSGGSSNDNSKYSRLEEVKNYEVTKRIKHEVKSPGKVKRLSVAVIIDRKIDQEQTASLEQIVKAAVGINEERGDSLVIRNLDFDNSLMEKQIVEMGKEKQLTMILSIAKAVGISIFVLIFIIFLYNAIKKIPASVGVGGNGNSGDNLMEEEFADIEDERIKLEREVELELEKMEKLSLPTAEAQKKQVMQKKLEHEIKTNTGEFVRLLRSWLAED